MNESSGNERIDQDAMSDFNIVHGLEYILYISLVLIVLVSLYIDVVTH